MGAKRVILWRHGTTGFNTEGRIQGASDVPLNATGREEARLAAAQLAKRFIPLSIVSSDLGRARETAQALANLVDVEVTVDERLRERAFGKLEGLTAKEMRRDYPDFYERWRSTGECPVAGIEMRRTVGKRVSEGIIDAAAHAEGGRTLVVVSHGSALTQGLVTLLGLDPSAWAGIRGLDNGHWAEILTADRAPKWRISTYNAGVKG